MAKVWEVVKKIFKFLWKSNSVWSWIINIILAFLIVKFIILPILGLAFGTGFPIVAVMSNSMEHNGDNFDIWWEKNKVEYEQYDITKEQFKEFPLSNGFNKGDLVIAFGPKEAKVGDVLIFQAAEAYPLIHRIVEIKDGKYTTKGDNNAGSRMDEIDIQEGRLLAKASSKIGYLGWLKIGFMKIIGKGV